MASLDRGGIDGARRALLRGLEPHQLKAAASPHLPLKQLVGDRMPPDERGNFKDLESLLDQLGAPPVFELGKPLPGERYIPKARAGDCPATHNRALLDQN